MTSLFSRLFVASSGLVQYAALPYRRQGDALSIALVTSRGTGRWIVPKGWPEPGKEPAQVAAMEAFEEAGLLGEIEREPVGAFTYRKGLHTLASATCRVEVFPLHVTEQRAVWPEGKERERVWLGPEAAAKAVQEKDLARIIRDFAASKG